MTTDTKDKAMVGQENEAQTGRVNIKSLQVVAEKLRETEAPFKAVGDCRGLGFGAMAFCVEQAIAELEESRRLPTSHPVSAEAEKYIQSEIDRAPALVQRLGAFLADVLDEDHWKTAEGMLLRIVALNAFPPAPQAEGEIERVEIAARRLAEWIGYSWDGLREDRIVGFPQWSFSGIKGLKFQGGKQDLRDLAANLQNILRCSRWKPVAALKSERI